MSTQIHKNIIVMFLAFLVFGCMEPIKPDPFPAPFLGSGETGNRRTNAFRDTVITQATNLKDIRVNGQAVFSTPFNVYDGLGDGPSNPMNFKEPGGPLTLPAHPSYGNIDVSTLFHGDDCHASLQGPNET